jgi:2-oxoglutarate/2-oxoacid ferredoxin oxidoreductase subunit beta
MEKKLTTGRPNLVIRTPMPLSTCPGCQHPIIARAISEVLDDLNLGEKTIAIGGVGCASIGVFIMNVDVIMLAHGHAPDGAAVVKRIYPDSFVFTLQGDGDCIAIGAGPLINASARADKITIIMLNNTNFGTTGGQLAPTTLMGQVTTTTPSGRDASAGYPVHVPELIATMKGVVYCARGSVHTPANYQYTKKYLRKAFQKQLDNVGLSFVEILSACPPDWHLSPIDCLKRIEEEVIAEYPLGEFKDIDKIQ